jgi:hypothetical protein
MKCLAKLSLNLCLIVFFALPFGSQSQSKLFELQRADSRRISLSNVRNIPEIPESTNLLQINSGQGIQGSNLSVDLLANLSDGQLLGAATIEIHYDPTVIKPIACTPDPANKFSVKICNINFENNGQNPDSIRLGVVSSTGISSQATIASITFQLKGAPGSSTPLNLIAVTFVNTTGVSLPVTTQNGQITVTTPKPTIASLSPSSVIFGGPVFTLTVNGTNFINGSVVKWNGSARATTYVSNTKLTATISGADIASVGVISLTVYNPAPVNVESSPYNFYVNNPLPIIANIIPSSLLAGESSFKLIVNGTNFFNGSTIQWNGAGLATTFVSNIQLTANIDPQKIASGGLVNISVVNPAPGGGTSAPLTLTVINPQSTISKISPTSIMAGSPGFTLTVIGSKFVPASVIRWNGVDLATTWINSTQLAASIDASKVATGGTVSVSVFTPAPGGGTTSVLTFTIKNPVPKIVSLSPASVIVGGPTFTLAVNGAGFVPASIIRWNGVSLATTYVNSTQLTTSIDASLIVKAGTASVTVYNPGPAGGTSAKLKLAINNPVPILTSLTPVSTLAGGPAFQLSLTGSNFVPGVVVRINGSSVSTARVSSTQLIATIDAGKIAVAGMPLVTVVNPTPGGGASSTLPFTINNPVPVITGLSPASTVEGGAAFKLTVNGSSFVRGSVVR